MTSDSSNVLDIFENFRYSLMWEDNQKIATKQIYIRTHYLHINLKWIQ
jgi:hypothetical protein